MKYAIHTPAERVVSVTCEGHQWLFRFPEGSLGKEPSIAEAEYKGSEKPHDPELEKQARNEAIKEAAKQRWDETYMRQGRLPQRLHLPKLLEVVRCKPNDAEWT